MNERMAKIDGKWQPVELIWGDCETCVVLCNGNKITISSGKIETITGYESRMRREAAIQPIRGSMTDATLVVDPDMVGTY